MSQGNLSLGDLAPAKLSLHVRDDYPNFDISVCRYRDGLVCCYRGENLFVIAPDCSAVKTDSWMITSRIRKLCILACLGATCTTNLACIQHRLRWQRWQVTSDVDSLTGTSGLEGPAKAASDSGLASTSKTSRLPQLAEREADIQLAAFEEAAETSAAETDSNSQIPSEYTLDNAITMALASHPAIHQAQANVRQTVGIRDQVGLCPNPTLGYTGDQIGDGGTDMNGGFLAQDIVFGRKLIKNVHVLQRAVDVQQAVVEVQRQRVVTDVKVAFVRLLATQRRIELTRDFCEVARKGVELAKKRLDAKEGTRPELLQTEIQLNQLELTLKRAEVNRDGQWRQLAAMMGVPDLPAQDVLGQLSDFYHVTESWDERFPEILESSPEILVANSRLCMARAYLDRQSIQHIPNLGTELAYGYDAGTHGQFTRIQLGLPLPVHNANQGNVDAAQASCASASANLERVTSSLRTRFAETSRDFASAKAAVSSIEQEILPRAKESLELSERAYAAGEFDFLQVLLVRRTFFDANIEYVTALEELAVNQVLLEGALISGGFDEPQSMELDDGLRGQALSGT